ncbi:MAG: hypothetical protein IJ313_01260 [Clostridia bacterium]|nr:hypothetical protein [Clostridia bacterium]
MRLREREKTDVGVYKQLGRSDDVYQWHNPVTIRAAVYPAGRSLDPKIYGNRVTEMRLMLYDGDVELEVGMGVSLDGTLPAYLVKSLEKWDHQRAVLELIPPGRRG